MATDPTFIIAVDQATFLRNGLRDLTPSAISADHGTCSICLDDLNSRDGGRVVQIRHCNHAFHHRCLVSWFRSSNGQHNSCPNCRVQLFPSRYDESQNERLLNLVSQEMWEDHSLFDHLADEGSEPQILGDPIFMPSSTPPRLAFERQNGRHYGARNATNFDFYRSGNDPIRLRGVNEVYRRSIRSNAETERENQVRQDIARAVRATDGFEPLPACLLPRSEGEEYVGIEQRRRQQIEERIRTEYPDVPDDRVQEEVNRQWSQRTQFMRDLEQLESIRGFVVPFLRAAGLRGDELMSRSHLTNEQYRVYGVLLYRVMPRGVVMPQRRVHLIEADHPVLADEVRHFLPVDEAERHSLYPVGMDNEARDGPETTMENLRLTHFVASGASRHYIRLTEGQRNLQQYDFGHTNWLQAEPIPSVNRVPTPSTLNPGTPPIYIPSQFHGHRHWAMDAPGIIIDNESLYPSHRSNPTHTPSSMLQHLRSQRSTPRHTPIVINTLFRSTTGAAQALGTSEVDGMPRGPNASWLMDPEYLQFQWQQQNAAVAREALLRNPRADGALQDRDNPSLRHEAECDLCAAVSRAQLLRNRRAATILQERANVSGREQDSIAPPAQMDSNVREEAVSSPAGEELYRDHSAADIPESIGNALSGRTDIPGVPPSPASPNTGQTGASSSQRRSSSPRPRTLSSTFRWGGFIPRASVYAPSAPADSSVPASHPRHVGAIHDPSPATATTRAPEMGPPPSATPPSSQQLAWGFASYRDLFPTMGELENANPHALNFFRMPVEYVPIYDEFRRRILGVSPSPLTQLQFDRLFPRVATRACLSQTTIDAQARFLNDHRHVSHRS